MASDAQILEATRRLQAAQAVERVARKDLEAALARVDSLKVNLGRAVVGVEEARRSLDEVLVGPVPATSPPVAAPAPAITPKKK